jgi:hypothetical protein
MDPRTRAVHPFVRAPLIRAGTLARLRGAGYEVDAAYEVGDRMDVQAITSWRLAPSPPLSHVISVSWDAEGAAAIAPMTQAEAALELRDHSHTLRRLEHAAWPQLSEMLASVPCFRLLCGPDLREAVGLVRRLVDGASPLS